MGGVARRERSNSWRNGLGARPHRWSIDRRAVPEKANTYPLAPDERQRKEELVHSITSKTPARTTPRTGDLRTRRKHLLRVPLSPVPRRAILLFLFWTVHGPFASGLRAAASRRLASGTRLRAQSLFLLEGKLGPRAACRVGRGGRNGAERSPRRYPFFPARKGGHPPSGMFKTSPLLLE